MFKNPGTKIKNLANSLFILLCILPIAIPLLMMAAEFFDDDLFFLVPVLALLGIGASYLSCLFLAAFGELVETNTQLLEEARKKNADTEYTKL